MSAYSASIYSVDEEGNTSTTTNTTTAPPIFPSSSSSSSSPLAAPPSFFPASSRRPLPIFGMNSGPSSARPRPPGPPAPLPSFAFPPAPPTPAAAPPPPPLLFAPGPAPSPSSLPTYVPSSMGSVFTATKAGNGMKDLSEMTVLAELVISAFEKDSHTSTIIGTIKQKMLHQAPDFVAALKELAEKTDEVAKTTRLTEHFKHLEVFRVEAALTNTLNVLKRMTAELLAVVSSEKKLAKHVRVKILDRLGKLHYGVEQIVRGLELALGLKLAGYGGLLVKIKEVRSVLKAQIGGEDSGRA